MEPLIAYAAGGWIPAVLLGLSRGAVKSRWLLAIIFAITIVVILVRFLAFGVYEANWFFPTFIVLCGAMAGLVGPAVSSRWFFALPISAVLGLFVPIFAGFAAAPLLIALMVAVASLANAPSSTDALLSMPIFPVGAAAISVFIMGSGVVVALVLRSLERRQSRHRLRS